MARRPSGKSLKAAKTKTLRGPARPLWEAEALGGPGKAWEALGAGATGKMLQLRILWVRPEANLREYAHTQILMCISLWN